MKDIFTWLLLLVPASLVSAYLSSDGSALTFAVATLAVIPLAEWIRRGTEHLALRAGPAIGGLLNVSFGNTAELILALFVLAAGKGEVVKAQLTGAIIGNSLLGLGLSIIVGSIGRDKQTFNRAHAGQLASLLLLSTIGLTLPALFDYSMRGATPSGRLIRDEHLSLAVSAVLITVYVANLVYTLVTHRDVFAYAEDDAHDAERHVPWPVWKALAVLATATVATAFEAELISGALESTAAQLGLSEFFLGIILLAVIGNVAEYVSAMYFARKNQMGLAVSITVGSTIQISLLVAPVLVIVSALMGTPMNLVFSSPLELVAIGAVVFAVNAIAHDGETTWFEGVLLLATYVLFGLAFFFV
ncbi:MAG TPA: calcium/proton exchanger [Vicinamibacterales bacterium]|jgi:Ca2+:H+ antiporter